MKKYEQRFAASKSVLDELSFTSFRALKVSSMLFDLMWRGDILSDSLTWEQIPVVLDARLLDYDFIFDAEKDNN